MGFIGKVAMEPLRVETVTFAVRIECDDGRSMRGRMFMPPISRHMRPMRPEERLNEAGDFVPFAPEDGSRAVLLNKRRFAVVALPLAEARRFGGVVEGFGAQRVALECNGKRYVGTVSCDTVGSGRRVLDLLNRPEDFLVLETADEQLLIRKASISQIGELDAERRDAPTRASAVN